MLASLLWTACGVLAALVAAFRVQLALLSWDPFSGWGALACGLVVGALGLVLVCTTGLWRCSWLVSCALAALLSLGTLGLGYYAATHLPVGVSADEAVRGEWPQLHPVLRLAVWLAQLSGNAPALAGIVSGAQADCAPRHAAHSGDGYLGAVDLRFAPAGQMRTWLHQGLFVLTGFELQEYPSYLHLALPLY